MTRYDKEQARFIVFSAFPKTGSTLLPDLILRLLKSKVHRFGTAYSKNNFRYFAKEYQNFFYKTHDVPSVFIKKVLKSPLGYEDFINSDSSKVFSSKASDNVVLIYNYRNPFNVLLSAIDYSKLLMKKKEVTEKWRKSGKDILYFTNLLGLKEVPDPGAFDHFKVKDLSKSHLSDIVWKFVDSRGEIPIFGRTPYFDHVNIYSNRVDSSSNAALVTYEDMMSCSQESTKRIARLMGLDWYGFDQALTSMHADRTNGDDPHFKKGFYSKTRTTTPSFIRELDCFSGLKDSIFEQSPLLGVLV